MYPATVGPEKRGVTPAIRVALLGSAAAVVLGSAATSAAAEGDPSLGELRRLIELQQEQLEAQSQQLEQQRRQLEEMRETLDQVDDRRSDPGGLTIPSAVEQAGTTGEDVPLPAPRPRDSELDELRRKVEQLEQAQAEDDPEVAPAQAVTAGDRPGTFKLPGTDTSVEISGYVKGDFIYDVDADTGDSFAASAIPIDGSPEDERDSSTRLHARQTRITLATYTPSPLGDVNTFIQGDFFGGGGNEIFSNSTSFRIRHAYGDLGPLRVGQNWTLFMPLDSYPATVDFFGPAGIPFIRQGQVRYTHVLDDNWTIAGSVENSETSGLVRTADGDLATFGESSGDLNFGIDRAPDLVAAVEYQRGDFSWKASGVGRILGADDGIDIDDETLGWGVFTGGVVPVLGDTPLGEETSLLLNFTYGDGVGRYIINGAFNGAFLDEEANDIDRIESWGFAGALQHQWSENWSSNLVYGRYGVMDTFAPDATDSLNTIHANVFWNPVERVALGLEYIYGQRNFENSDFDNSAQRFQFGAQYFF